MRKKRTLRQKPREAFATKKKTELEIGGAEADDEIDEPKENRRKTIQQPIGASTVHNRCSEIKRRVCKC